MYALSLLVFFHIEKLAMDLILPMGMVRKSNNLKNIAIAHVKKSAYRIYFLYMSKREAKNLMNNSNLIDKKGIL